MKKSAANDYTSTTQNFLDIYDICDNMIVMKNGAVSSVLSVGAMNFGLLAEAEQDAIIYAYAGLLNSINYPIQIVIQSQTKDATSYLNRLKQSQAKASSQRKKDLIQRYSTFVSELIKERNVLDKKFYVIINTTALEMGFITAQSFVPSKKGFDINNLDKTSILEKAINILEPRMEHLISQFNRIGLYAQQLNTQEIIQIFYNNYNPEATEGQKITDSSSYTTSLIQANIKGDNMNTNPQNPNKPGESTGPNPVATQIPGIDQNQSSSNQANPVGEMPISGVSNPGPAVTLTPDEPQPNSPVTPAAQPSITPDTTAPLVSPVTANIPNSTDQPASNEDKAAELQQEINASFQPMKGPEPTPPAESVVSILPNEPADNPVANPIAKLTAEPTADIGAVKIEPSVDQPAQSTEATQSTQSTQPNQSTQPAQPAQPTQTNQTALPELPEI